MIGTLAGFDLCWYKERMITRERISEWAEEQGFDAVGVATADEALHRPAFDRWLAAGHHGDMAWLARDPSRRADPRQVVDGARSVIMFSLSYFTEEPDPVYWNDPARGRMARYAWGPDYHEVMLPRLMRIKERIEADGHGARAYVDTGPLLERTWAAQAGLGFIGRNALLIRPTAGSFSFLGGIICSLDLAPDPPATEGGARLGKGNCGACTRCLTACPTGAFAAPYVVDSRRCISYLTIELKRSIPVELRPQMGNWIYGCDVCQEVCPWVRRFSQPGRTRFVAFDPDRFCPSLTELMQLDDDGFRARYRDTPIRRTKRRGLLRNAAVALGNGGDREALPVLRAALSDPEPLIQTHAAWAIEQIEQRDGTARGLHP